MSATCAINLIKLGTLVVQRSAAVENLLFQACSHDKVVHPCILHFHTLLQAIQGCWLRTWSTAGAPGQRPLGNEGVTCHLGLQSARSQPATYSRV